MNTRGSGATAAVTGRGDRLQSWFLHHRLVAVSSLAELLRSPVASVMTWLMIGIAMALPTILYLMLVNVSDISGQWGGKPKVSVYLNYETTDEAARQLAQDVMAEEGVESATFISRNEALQTFQQRSGFGEVLTTLERNPLPHVIEIVPESADPLALATRVKAWEALETVDSVSVDLKWLERLFALLQFSERLVSALALVLGAGVVLVMGNTIRLAILNRREEIEIIKLVGGTDAFVRRPFLYLGFWYGAGGAITALLLTQVSILVLAGPVEALAQSYRNEFALSGPGFSGALLILFIGVMLGVIGALLAVGRHLHEIEPT